VFEGEERAVQALRRFWAKSMLNKVTLLMSFSLVFCCCGWTGRIGDGSPDRTVNAAPSVAEMFERPAHWVAGR